MPAGKNSPEHRRILAEAAKIKDECARRARHTAAKSAMKRKRPAINGSALLLLFFFIGALLTALPTAIILGIGMLPTVVAYLVDRTPGRCTTMTVAGLNFTGVAPYLMKLWMTKSGIANAVAIVVDPFALVVMYGAAGAG